MRSLLFVAAALTLTPDADLEDTRDLELIVQIDGNSLVTWNPTDEPELVLLQDPISGAASSFVVPALSGARLEIPCEVNFDLRLFGAARVDDELSYTDQWSLADVAAYGTVWLEIDQGMALSWINTDAGFVTVAPTCPPLSSSTLVTTTTVHVSVITQYDGTTGDTPPQLSSEPLPPF